MTTTGAGPGKYGKLYDSEADRKRAARNRRRQRKLDEVNRIKTESGCVDCGWNVHPAGLEFDHDPEFVKVEAVSRLIPFSMDRIRAEIAKCDVVCANCHRLRSVQRGQWHGWETI
jgi:hypothetical protein